MAAMHKKGKPTVARKDKVVVITNFPPICATEADAYKETAGGVSITAGTNEIILKNAPADLIAALDG